MNVNDKNLLASGLVQESESARTAIRLGACVDKRRLVWEPAGQTATRLGACMDSWRSCLRSSRERISYEQLTITSSNAGVK